MKKNLIKALLKAAATTALAATMFIGSSSEAKAMTLEEYALAVAELPVSEVKASKMLMDDYRENWANDSMESIGEVKKPELNQKIVDIDAKKATAGTAILQRELLDLVNADRAENGAGALVWDEELEQIALQRAVEVMANFHSKEMAEYKAANGVYAGYIAHMGAQSGENAIWIGGLSAESVEIANADWILSKGHHENRIDIDYKKYAAASYVDPVTLEEVWVELFW